MAIKMGVRNISKSWVFSKNLIDALKVVPLGRSVLMLKDTDINPYNLLLYIEYYSV